jgi:hypothetical protein
MTPCHYKLQKDFPKNDPNDVVLFHRRADERKLRSGAPSRVMLFASTPSSRKEQSKAEAFARCHI